MKQDRQHELLAGTADEFEKAQAAVAEALTLHPFNAGVGLIVAGIASLGRDIRSGALDRYPDGVDRIESSIRALQSNLDLLRADAAGRAAGLN